MAGRFDLSAARLSEAIQLAPEDERARLALADVLVEAGRSAEASQALAATVAALPDSGQAHFRLGQLNLSQSLFPPAVRELKTAAGLTPLIGLDRLYEMLGGVYASQASFDDAVAAYLTRIDVNPNNADAHKSLGEIYALQGRHDEALAEFAATLLIDPKNEGALVGASQVFLRIGRFDEALDLSKQALALDDRLKDARYALAMSLLRLGRQDEGRRELATFERMQAEVMAAMTRQSELNTIRRDASQRLHNNDYAAAATPPPPGRLARSQPQRTCAATWASRSSSPDRTTKRSRRSATQSGSKTPSTRTSCSPRPTRQRDGLLKARRRRRSRRALSAARGRSACRS